jgi:glycosyltransferase involved in cell wall biosynthesis
VKDPTRVLALVPYPTGRVPGQRYRIEQWAPALRQHGVVVAFAPFLGEQAMDVLYERGHLAAKVSSTLRGYAERLTHVFRRHRPDVVFVYREAAPLAPTWFERLATWRAPLVFDFDDAIYLPASSAANSWTRHLRQGRKVEALCRMSRHVMVGNAVLADFARRHNTHVSIVPSTIDTTLYQPRARARNARPIVGWTGSTTTLPHLLGIAPALRRLRESVDFELRVIGGAPAIDGVDVCPVPWRRDREVDDLVPLDVGLMPLPDDEWSRGKCGMKALQYMALAIPPVVSPVGANRDIVQDGVNGFHARTPDEWVDRLAELLRDETARARLGAAARATVEQRYSAVVQVPRVAELFREVAA